MKSDKQEKKLFWLIITVAGIFLLSMLGKLFS
ncbi:hypothetical protein N783_02205 [Pontibacillus marinus BH030004 = DSM 16465]|uniref:DUF4044 domain-containing protein n=1 Tax=Pontibacillus marinus BH030004 = DSM 16465 TaxID=1385511 RepID=A0A0A5FX14_9BACI|nr:hypothetical protein N783_02205 [Pontibacillus marinus BH030004 = DSM 16465]